MCSKISVSGSYLGKMQNRKPKNEKACGLNVCIITANGYFFGYLKILPKMNFTLLV
jgi:hypothetical protein